MSKFHAIYGNGGVSPEPGGDTYGEVQTLLWTNPSIHTDFNPQTVTLDLTSYDGVIIEFNTDNTGGALGTRVKSGKTSIGAGFTSINKDGSFSRNFVISNSGVVFDNGYLNSNPSPGHCVPIKIYGYKQYETGNIEFNWSVSSSTNASESIGLNNKYTAPLDGYYKRSAIAGFTNATSNLTTEFAYKKAGDEITLNVSKSAGTQVPSTMTIYYSSKGDN